MAKTTAIWDVYLSASTTISCSEEGSSSRSGDGHGGSSKAAPEYLLQVLGRSGEPPAVPKTLSVWLNHVGFNPERKLHFRVQTGPGGVVHLGHLIGEMQSVGKSMKGTQWARALESTRTAWYCSCC